MSDYVPQEWVDDDGSGTTGTAVTADRMNHIEQGIKDMEGLEGPPGPQGDPGPPGADGAPGPQGDPGPPGADGADGAPGPPGADGATGPTGATGPEGPTGPAGPQGEPGPQGPAGTGINLLGTLASTDDLPTDAADGDTYIIDGDGWTWTGTEWVNVGPIQGPAGPAGPAGVEGPTGPAGPKGDTGATGPAGADGAPGPKGDKGDTGAAGATGPPGPSTGPAGGDLSGNYPNPVVVRADNNFAVTNQLTVGHEAAIAGSLIGQQTGNAESFYNLTVYQSNDTTGAIVLRTNIKQSQSREFKIDLDVAVERPEYGPVHIEIAGWGHSSGSFYYLGHTITGAWRPRVRVAWGPDPFSGADPVLYVVIGETTDYLPTSVWHATHAIIGGLPVPTFVAYRFWNFDQRTSLAALSSLNDVPNKNPITGPSPMRYKLALGPPPAYPAPAVPGTLYVDTDDWVNIGHIWVATTDLDGFDHWHAYMNVMEPGTKLSIVKKGTPANWAKLQMANRPLVQDTYADFQWVQYWGNSTEPDPAIGDEVELTLFIEPRVGSVGMPSFLSEWSSVTQYILGDIVVKDGVPWMAFAGAPKGVAPTTESGLWQAWPGMYRGAWTATSRYRTGDRVLYNGSLYMGVATGNPWVAATTPDADTTRWRRVSGEEVYIGPSAPSPRGEYAVWIDTDEAPNAAPATGAFHAYDNDAAFTLVADGTFRKVKLNAEEFDSNNWFDTTNWRYTPQRAGLYQFNALVSNVDPLNAGDQAQAALYKNGVIIRRFNRAICPTVAPTVPASGGSAIVQANGTTDYFELYYYQVSSGGPARRLSADPTQTYLDGNYIGA